MLRTAAWRARRQCLPRPLRLAMASTRPGLGGRPLSTLTVRCFVSTLSGRGDILSEYDPPPSAVKNGVGYWNSESKVTKSQAKLLTALRAYKKKHGDLLVPQAVAVPSGDDSWPSVIWGYKLGAAVSKMRGKLKQDRVSAEMMQELDDMEFVRDVSQYRCDRIFLPALLRFHEVHGHTDVPIYFVVPTGDEEWPKLAWGEQLGQWVSNVRLGATYTVQLAKSEEDLRKLQFCYKTSISERDWTEKILPSIRVYRQEFGDCIVQNSFVVPASPPWPEKAWEMPLGVVIRDIRTGKPYMKQVARDKDILDGLGFAWNRSAAVWNEEIIPALQVFAKVYKGRQLPSTFVVPSEKPWPSRVWGMRLGATIGRLRWNGTYFAHYGREFEKLEELGVNMKMSARIWRLRVVPLLEMYATLYVDQEVPCDFCHSVRDALAGGSMGSSAWPHRGSQLAAFATWLV